MGPQFSRSENEIFNIVKGAIKVAVENQVRNNVNVSCSNIQSIANAKNCNIQFAEQMCDAVAISHFTSDMTVDTKLNQDIMNQIQAKAAATTEGLGSALASISHASNYVKNLTDVSMSATQALTTTCTRSASAINIQSILNCDGGVYNFAPQTVSTELIGDCVANQTSSLQAQQKITNILDIEAEAKVSGLSLAGMFMFFLVIGVAIFAVPMFIRAMKSALTSSDEKKNGGGHMSRGKYYFSILSFILLLLSFIWWILLATIYLGEWPGTLIANNPDLCKDGKNIDADTFINNWMWYDPYCIAKDSGIGGSTNGCYTAEDKSRHYEKCGLFASQFGCDDALFKAEEVEYKNALEACAKVPKGSVDACTVGNIAVSVFAEGEESYPGCHKCIGTSEEEKKLSNPRRNYGLWAQDGKSCSAGIDHKYYKRTDSSPCPANDTYCMENQKDLESYSPNECMIDAYQDRKKRFSTIFRGCEEIQQTTKVTEEKLGSFPFLEQQCPPRPFLHFSKCDGSTSKCTYMPQQCTCDNTGQNCDCSDVDPKVIASCKNDLDGCCQKNEQGDLICIDEDYQNDLHAYNVANDTCLRQQQTYKALNPLGWIIPLILDIFLILYLGYVVVSPGVAPGIGTAVSSLTSSTSFNVFIFVLLLLGVIVGGWPLGFLAMADKGSSYSIYDTDSGFAIEEGLAKMIGYPLFVISCILLVVFLFLKLKNWLTGPKPPKSQIG